MFNVPKPRPFHYTPRFYDPEKERWEALKQKYAEAHPTVHRNESETEGDNDADLEYFERRVRELDSKSREESMRLGWRDLFRKREMPQFRYTPRFDGRSEEGKEGETAQAPMRKKVKIKRRFDISDDDYLKPIPATRIILYCGLVCLLIYWIFF